MIVNITHPNLYDAKSVKYKAGEQEVSEAVGQALIKSGRAKAVEAEEKPEQKAKPKK